jgi:hypothetical protein
MAPSNYSKQGQYRVTSSQRSCPAIQCQVDIQAFGQSRLTLTLQLSGLITPQAVLAVQEVWWNVIYVQMSNLMHDGLHERGVIRVNNSWPYDKILP